MTEHTTDDLAPAPLWSYRPGSWYAVFGPLVAVALPADQKDRVGALWSLVDSGAGFDEVLDALLVSGLSRLPAFALVSSDQHTTRVLLRGVGTSARLVADAGEVALDGAAGGTWVERSVDGVTALTVGVEEAETGETGDLAIPTGLVRVSRIDRPAVATAPAAPEPPVEEPITDVIEVPQIDVPLVQEVGPPPEPSPLESPGWTEPRFAGAALPEPLADAIPDLPPPPPPLSVGAWQSSQGPTGPTGPPPQAPPTTQVLPSAPGAVATLLVSDGQTVPVTGVVLIGRAPEARRFTEDEQQPQLVTVPSRLHEISSTHVEVRPGTGVDQGTAVVTDMGSTNGTVLVRPGLAPEDLKPGISVALVPGAVINLGDGITIQVASA